MILGLRTAIYPVVDLAAGRDWYAAVLGFAAYFDEPFYVGFQVGGFELGLIPDGTPGAQGVQVFWGVADVIAEVARLVGLGRWSLPHMANLIADLRPCRWTCVQESKIPSA